MNRRSIFQALIIAPLAKLLPTKPRVRYVRWIRERVVNTPPFDPAEYRGEVKWVNGFADPPQWSPEYLAQLRANLGKVQQDVWEDKT